MGFIGAGQMATALARGFIRAGRSMNYAELVCICNRTPTHSDLVT